MSQEVLNEIHIESSNHHYRTEVPNIVFLMGLTPTALAFYTILKWTAGDKGGCFKSNSTLASNLNCSVRLIPKLKAELQQKNLIRIKKQLTDKGGVKADLITIVDIWPQNYEYMSTLFPKNKANEVVVVPTREAKNKGGVCADSAHPLRRICAPPSAESAHKEEEIEEELYKKNDIDRAPESSQAVAEFHLSSEMDKSIASFDSESFFNPLTYKLPDGTLLSRRMANALNKYTAEERFRLISNIRYFEECVKNGRKPRDSYEKMLQGYVKNNYAAQQDSIWQNRNYALVMKEMHGLKGLTVLKTVVQMKRGLKDQPESISLNLPVETFSVIINKYIQTSLKDL